MSKLVMILAVLAVSATAVVNAAPWIQGVDLPLPREVDPEAPVTAHEDDCRVFYLHNHPMTCGEDTVFHPGLLACVPPHMVADVRPECAEESKK